MLDWGWVELWLSCGWVGGLTKMSFILRWLTEVTNYRFLELEKKIVMARGHIPTIWLKVWLSMCIKYKVFCCQMCSSKGSQDDNLDSWGGKMKFYPLSVELHNFYCSTQYFWSSDRETLFAWQGVFMYQGDSGSIFWWW